MPIFRPHPSQEKRLFFLAGLARTGSTVLTALLNQHPEIYASGTSPLMDLLYETDRTISELGKRYTFDDDAQQHQIYSGIIRNFYRHIDKPVIFDKHRGWPRNGLTLTRFVPEFRMVCTVRPMAEVIASFLTLIERHEGKPNFVDIHLQRRGLALTKEHRAHFLWEHYGLEPYKNLLFGLRHFRDRILLVTYKDLVQQPLAVLEQICHFIQVRPYHGYDLNRLENKSPEKDEEVWAMPGLHEIRPQLGATSPPAEAVLGLALTRHFQQFDRRLS